MDKDKAAEEFSKMLFQQGFQGSLESVASSLQEPPVGSRLIEWEAAKKWCDRLDERDKSALSFLLTRVSVSAIFGIACFLDGASGYQSIEGYDSQPADFIVSLRTYKDVTSYEMQVPAETIQVCPTEHGEDVHDIFLSLVDEAEAADSSQIVSLP